MIKDLMRVVVHWIEPELVFDVYYYLIMNSDAYYSIAVNSVFINIVFDFQ